MPVSIQIPANLRAFTAQQTNIVVVGATVAVALEHLCQQHPQLRDKLLSDAGELHSFVNVFVQGRGIRELNGLATPLSDGDTLLIVPALAGG